MSSASPSGASSHATQTGRPSLWTDSNERKLTRLYIFTTLPIRKILDVLQASSPDAGDGPGKDSANKKLNSMLDKEPRWLHPRSRTDMERRMQELGNSPTRHTPARSPLSRPHANSTASSIASRQSIVRDMKDEAVSPIIHDIQPADALNVPPGAWNRPPQPLPTITTHSEPPLPPLAGCAVPPSSTKFESQYSPAAILRRATVMTSSTQMSTGTLNRALSEYSTGFVRHVAKVIKRYTMPVEPGVSPITEDRPPTPDSTRGSWMYDENAPPSAPNPRPLPGHFLNLEARLQEQGFCVEGLQEHNTRECLCHVAHEIDHALNTDPDGHSRYWVSRSGPLSSARQVLEPSAMSSSEWSSGKRDGFGNTALHLLASRGSPELLLRAIDDHPDPSATNSAGQTFLHCLHESWFRNIAAQGAPLFRLIQKIKRVDSVFYACDVYGRNFFHMLHLHGCDARIVNIVLRGFQPMSYCRRDALGLVPQTHAHNMPPLQRAWSSLAEPPRPSASDATPHLASDNPAISKQARLLQYVRESLNEPKIEDSQGRNGLHCLAASILSEETLLHKYANPPAASNNTAANEGGGRKRKRDNPPPLKHSDSTKERLTLRETCVHNLIQSGVDVNHYDAHGSTVLMAFVAQLPEDDDYKVPVSILQLLIEAGANVNARNRAGETALHIAVRRGRKLAMRTLQQNGANVYARDGAGRSVLDVADARVRSLRDNKMYAHSIACRGWLSGQGRAVQHPTVLQEWGWSDMQ